MSAWAFAGPAGLEFSPRHQAYGQYYGAAQAKHFVEELLVLVQLRHRNSRSILCHGSRSVIFWCQWCQCSKAMALQITSLMWLRTIMHLGIVSGIVLTEMGPVDLQLLRVIGKIWSNFLNVLLFFFVRPFLRHFCSVMPSYKMALTYQIIKWSLPSAVWARTMWTTIMHEWRPSYSYLRNFQYRYGMTMREVPE